MLRRGALSAANVSALLTLVDPVAVLLGGLVVPGTGPGGAPLVSLLCAALAATLVCRVLGLHRSRLRLSVLDDLPQLLLAAAVAALVVLGVTQTGAVTPTWDRWWLDLAGFGLLSFTGLVVLRLLAYALVHVLRRGGAIAHPVLIVGTGSVGRRVADALATRRELGLVPVGMVDDLDVPHQRGLPLPLVGGVGELEQTMHDLDVQDVVIAFPEVSDERAVSAVRQCLDADHQVFVVPRFHELVAGVADRRWEMVRDVAVLRLPRRSTHASTRVARRVLDVAVAAVALVALSPLLLVLAVAVRLETGPGVLFAQPRVDAAGRVGTSLRFTTLRAPRVEDEATSWFFDNDERIGPVGWFLRRTGMDELPVLVDVVRGRHTLSGARSPRPAPRPVPSPAAAPRPGGPLADGPAPGREAHTLLLDDFSGPGPWWGGLWSRTRSRARRRRPAGSLVLGPTGRSAPAHRPDTDATDAGPPGPSVDRPEPADDTAGPRGA